MLARPRYHIRHHYHLTGNKEKNYRLLLTKDPRCVTQPATYKDTGTLSHTTATPPADICRRRPTVELCSASAVIRPVSAVRDMLEQQHASQYEDCIVGDGQPPTPTGHPNAPGTRID
ncbi:jg18656 [Pararge aegeria aegeria]|uniref:Jg18656 protein n=1 Tax=Pararge aegeria aegeria TaxID=348720 RepID=A0A8S4RB93_9NEOP|nr:jg18656 [Pararge aegeria aegeria]